MRFYLSMGRGYTTHGHKISYTEAEDDAYSEIREGIKEWLEENIFDRYFFDLEEELDEYVTLSLFVVFQEETDAMAYKLRWE